MQVLPRSDRQIYHIMIPQVLVSRDLLFTHIYHILFTVSCECCSCHVHVVYLHTGGGSENGDGSLRSVQQEVLNESDWRLATVV